MSAIHLKGTALAVLVTGLAFGPVAAENVDPGGDGSQYAWSENAGWLNAQPTGVGGPGLNVSDFAVGGYMWSENAGWVSLSCQNTASCGTANYGVANDGHGNLSGLAWAENVGWVNFATAQNQVQINPGTGAFSGYAWSENLGWVNFSTSGAGIKTSWCQSTPAIPTGAPDLRASRAGGDVVLSQLTIAGGAAWHEIVRGSLSSLRSSHGDFVTATVDCAGDNITAPNIVVPGTPHPAPGDGYWYLVRRVNCKGKGTFDSGAPSQSGSRDAEIAAANVGCP